MRDGVGELDDCCHISSHRVPNSALQLQQRTRKTRKSHEKTAELLHHFFLCLRAGVDRDRHFRRNSLFVSEIKKRLCPWD